jgi:hypothetical protein
MSEPVRHVEPDPLIDEIRLIRAKLDQRFGDDWTRYAEHLREAGRAFQENAATAKKTTGGAGQTRR